MDSAEDFKQGGLTGTVSADYPDAFSPLDVEIEIAKGPEILFGGGPCAYGGTDANSAREGARLFGKRFAQRAISGLMRDDEFFGKALGRND